MPNILQIAVLMLSLVLVSACGSDSSSRTPANGTAVFFHNIENAGELQLRAVNAENRNSYGRVDFETFSSPVSLRAGSWELEVIDNMGTSTTSDDVTVLPSTSFSVQPRRVRLVAFTGDVDASGSKPQYTVEMHQLPLAFDVDGDSDTQFINFSNLHKVRDNVDVYMIPDGVYNPADPLNGQSPVVSSLSFGGTSTTVELDAVSPDYHMIVTEAGNTDPNDILFNSGSRELRDYLQQTILISPNNTGAGDSDITAFYYGNLIKTTWQDKSGLVGSMRAFNAVDELVTGLTVIADNGIDDYQLMDDVVFGETGGVAAEGGFALDGAGIPHMSATDGIYTVTAYDDYTPGDAPIRGLNLDMWPNEWWTVIFYGVLSDVKAMAVLENFNASASRASVTFSNAAYFPDPDKKKAFDIHIKRVGSSQRFPQDTKAFSALMPGSFASARYTEADYQVIVTEADTVTGVVSPFSPVHQTFENGRNYHYTITNDPDLGGFQLKLISDCTFTPSVAPPLVCN